MPVTTFSLDERTLAAVRELQGIFGVKTNAAVLRKAIALAKITASKATPDHTVVISGGGDPITVSLAT